MFIFGDACNPMVWLCNVTAALVYVSGERIFKPISVNMVLKNNLWGLFSAGGRNNPTHHSGYFSWTVSQAKHMISNLRPPAVLPGWPILMQSTWLLMGFGSATLRLIAETDCAFSLGSCYMGECHSLERDWIKFTDWGSAAVQCRFITTMECALRHWHLSKGVTATGPFWDGEKDSLWGVNMTGRDKHTVQWAFKGHLFRTGWMTHSKREKERIKRRTLTPIHQQSVCH